MSRLWYFFFFQAEDGIRDVAVTGVQTCALPIWRSSRPRRSPTVRPRRASYSAATASSTWPSVHLDSTRDRKSTRLNSSHGYISYAVFCLKKKKKSFMHNLNIYTK